MSRWASSAKLVRRCCPRRPGQLRPARWCRCSSPTAGSTTPRSSRGHCNIAGGACISGHDGRHRREAAPAACSNCWSPEALQAFVIDAVRGAACDGRPGRRAARQSHAERLAALAPDFAGFRSAVCAGERSDAPDAHLSAGWCCVRFARAPESRPLSRPSPSSSARMREQFARCTTSMREGLPPAIAKRRSRRRSRSGRPARGRDRSRRTSPPPAVRRPAAGQVRARCCRMSASQLVSASGGRAASRGQPHRDVAAVQHLVERGLAVARRSAGRRPCAR
jgi:hypothetical protein